MSYCIVFLIGLCVGAISGAVITTLQNELDNSNK